jgi:hypothetical protein
MVGTDDGKAAGILFPLAHLGVHCVRDVLGRILHVCAAKSNGNVATRRGKTPCQSHRAKNSYLPKLGDRGFEVVDAFVLGDEEIDDAPDSGPKAVDRAGGSFAQERL